MGRTRDGSLAAQMNTDTCWFNPVWPRDHAAQRPGIVGGRDMSDVDLSLGRHVAWGCGASTRPRAAEATRAKYIKFSTQTKSQNAHAQMTKTTTTATGARAHLASTVAYINDSFTIENDIVV